ncbi:MAG: heme-binding protein [Phycisphaerae bacterium]|nr:heme-binding protein [Phycisphaerae bacterium]
MEKILLACFLLFCCLFLCSCVTLGIEKPRYDTIEKEGKFEIRQYPPQLLAETLVESEFDQAGNIAFRRLFDYISGNNRLKESISMTSPVKQQQTAQKIKMTVPVNLQQAQGKYAVSFFMPAKYTIETLPEPLDDNVKIRSVPARKMAVLRYSGTWSQSRYEKYRDSLKKLIQDKGLEIIGEDIFARYDPPFHLWFVRRNEVMFPVK